MNLTPRLQIIANLVPHHSLCGDIGTDHAYIPIYLIKNKICPKALATDVNRGPLEIAKNQIKNAGYEEYIETRLGDGLNPIGLGEIDTAIIAGMGGLLIRNILEDSREIAASIKTFILQPMIAQRELREYLLKNGYRIIEEDLAQEDQRVYEIIVAVHGTQEIEEDVHLDIGKRLLEKKHPLLVPLIDRKKNELLKIIQQCEGKNSVNAEKRLKECLVKLRNLEEVHKCL